jgi:phenylpropionate dioxygenase-like ring-hydroxylating dioxygenase large terminal subunit
MLSREDNILLTHVEPGSPLGQFFRRYWIPAAVSEEIPIAGGAPVRVGLLGERLVVFRDPAGKIGLVKEFCPHRGASLVYARNEPGGLRCLYHGWKIGHTGTVLETPPEPVEGRMAAAIRHPGYPTREAGGIIWTYMGRPDSAPAFPEFPWLHLPPDKLLVVKMYQDNNYLQGLEGDLDPAHPNYLHRDFTQESGKSWAGVGWQSMSDVMNFGVPDIQCEETPYLMRVGAIRKTPDPATNYVRLTEWVAPFYTYIATAPGESKLFKAWLPIDNERCFTFYIHYDPVKPLNLSAIYANWGHRTEPPDYRTKHTLANQHLQDRTVMETHNFSGVDGAAIQDRAVQESMGPIYDRTQENLGTSDKAVVYYRRLILRKLREMDAGKPLPAHDPCLDFQQQAASCLMPADLPWQQALHIQLESENESLLL